MRYSNIPQINLIKKIKLIKTLIFLNFFQKEPMKKVYLVGITYSTF